MRHTILLVLVVLAACTGGPGPERPRRAPAAPPAAGLDRVRGQTAAQLDALFGPPDLDVREAAARKLQYKGPICVLDAYLYARGGGAAVVTWIDARTPAGADFDRASCIAALSRRPAAR